MKTKMIFSIIILLIAILGVSFARAQKLKDIHIQKEVKITGSMEDVFEQVVYLDNFPNWSPFLEADPTQKIEIKGTDGQIGAQYHWLGNKGKDVGYQEIREIKPQKYIRMECNISKPFQAKPVFEYTFEEVGNQIRVTQDFSLKSSKTDAFFMWLFGAKKDMSKMNARGLELLKQEIEG